MKLLGKTKISFWDKTTCILDQLQFKTSWVFDLVSIFAWLLFCDVYLPQSNCFLLWNALLLAHYKSNTYIIQCFIFTLMMKWSKKVTFFFSLMVEWVVKHVTNAVGHFASFYWFILAELPKISLFPVVGSYREGSFVNISCTASETPEPDVIWTKEGTVIISRKGTAFLIFNSIRRTDDWWYLCRANNTAGSLTNQTTLVLYREY